MKKRGKRGGDAQKLDGSGGPWRAFIRINSIGKPGRADLHELAKQYRAAKEADADDPVAELYARSCQMAAAARLVDKRRGAQRAGSFFGHNTQQRQRTQRRALRDAVSLPEGDLATRSLHLSSQASTHGWTPKELVQRARDLAREEFRRQQERDERDASNLLWFAEKIGEPARERMVASHALPPGQHVPVPAPHGTVMHRLPDHQAAARGASWVQANQNKCGSLGRLLEEYRQMPHHTIMESDVAQHHQLHDDQQAPPKPPPRKVTCRSVGFCICSDDGKLRLKVKNGFLRSLKAFCPPKSRPRTWLADGRLVCRLGLEKIDADPDDLEGEADKWWHIGFVLFSPYRLAIQRLKRLPAPADGGEHRIHLQATSKHNKLCTLRASCRGPLAARSMEASELGAHPTPLSVNGS